MLSGLNLHGIVRGAVGALHPDIRATLYRSIGQTTNPAGQVKSIYAPGLAVTAQKQSEGPETLKHVDRVGQADETRKFYLFSSPGHEQSVAGVIRHLARGGDMLQLDADDWWLVVGVIEDFTGSGWVSVRAALQVIPPDFSNSEWWENEKPA